MPHQIGYVDNTSQLAHYAMLATIKTFSEANGWEVLRYSTSGTNHELILQGAGLSGIEEIFVGFRTYHDVGADYYNLLAGVFTGYAPLLTFDGQPGARLSGVPCHNQRVDYWLTLNAQRIALAMKVGTPVYQHAYVGKMLPYARPSQYPYPVVCAGALVGAAATRFSDTGHSSYYRGVAENLGLRTNGGWITPTTYPWSDTQIAGAGTSNTQRTMRDTNGVYLPMPVELCDASNIYGALDGVLFISGFDNVVENTLTLDGDTWVVFQDVWRTAHNAYYALRMDD